MKANNATIRRVLIALAVAALVLPATLGPMKAEDDVVLHSGAWSQKSYPIAGRWSLVQRGTERIVALDDKFKTKNAPDLKVFLSPLPLAKINGDNATEGALFVGKLTANKGRQELSIPARIDLKRFKTVIIHCERYSKVWGGAALEPPAER